jgi:hypothetical protein
MHGATIKSEDLILLHKQKCHLYDTCAGIVHVDTWHTQGKERCNWKAVDTERTKRKI